MSNVFSRRSFMKATGVAALAVAASGVLAGCSESTTKEVKITYVPVSSLNGDYKSTVKVSVVATATELSADYLKQYVPTGFELNSVAPASIVSDETGFHTGNVEIKLATGYKEVTITYVDADKKEVGDKQYIIVKGNEAIPKASLKVPTGYSLTDQQSSNFSVTGTAISIEVKKNA